MAATNGSYGDKFAPRVLYVRDAAGQWVYYLETRTEQDADHHARRLALAGRACYVTGEYRGSVTTPGATL